MVNEIPEDEDPDADITALTDEEYLQEERRVMALRNLEVEDEEIVPAGTSEEPAATGDGRAQL